MRKLSYAVMSIAIVTLTFLGSCRKPDNIITPTEPEKPATMTFGASLDDGSKTYINGKQILWSSGDKIKVNGVSCDLKSGAGTKSGTFQGAVDESNTYLAAHYGNNSNVTFLENNTKLQFTIPQTQNYIGTNDNTNLSGAIPIAAYSTGGSKDLTFRSMVNLVKVVLTSKEGINLTKVELFSDNNAQNLSGTFTVSTTDITAPTVASGTGASKTIQTGAISIAANSSKTIYFVIPVSSTADNNVGVKTTGTTKDSYKGVKLKNANTPNHLYEISIDLDHYFNVGSAKAAKYVKFSPGTFYQSYTDKKYYFYTNQTDVTTGTDPWGVGWEYPQFCLFYHGGTIVDAAAQACPITDNNSISNNEILFTNSSAEASSDITIQNYGTGWRALSYQEWQYLLTNQQRRCLAIANGVKGLLICPPDYPTGNPTGQTLYIVPDIIEKPDDKLSGYTTLSSTQWSNMQKLGVLFLPFAGGRWNSIIPFDKGERLLFLFSDFPMFGQPLQSSTYSRCGVVIDDGNLFYLTYWPWHSQSTSAAGGLNEHPCAGIIRCVKDVK